MSIPPLCKVRQIDLGRIGRSLFIIIILFSAPSSYSVAPLSWDTTSYSYDAVDVSVKKIIENFSDSFGVIPMMGDVVLSKKITEKIKSASVTAFLDKLAIDYKFRWYVYNGRLIISPLNDYVVDRLDLDVKNINDVKIALNGIGLLESKFGWGELPESSSVIISGPSRYVNEIKTLLATAGKEKSDREMMVFKLKYASVSDDEMTYRDKKIQVPGIASILKKLFGGKDALNLNGHSEMVLPDSLYNLTNSLTQSLYGLGQNQSDIFSGAGTARPNMLGAGASTPAALLSSLGSDKSTTSSKSKLEDSILYSRRAKNKMESIMIEAEPRTNSVIVRDYASNRKHYESLIAYLDVPQRMIEIEAMVIEAPRKYFKKFIGVVDNFKGDSFVRLNYLKGDVSNRPHVISGTTFHNNSNYEKLSAFVDDLQNNNIVKVLARQSVVTMDNMSAVIELNHTLYIPKGLNNLASVQNVPGPDSRSPSNVGMPNNSSNMSTINFGALLKVTPRIIEDNGNIKISMSINIEEGQTLKSPLSDYTDATNVQKSILNSNAILFDGKPMIVATAGRVDKDSMPKSDNEGYSIKVANRPYKKNRQDNELDVIMGEQDFPQKVFIIYPKIR